MNIKRLVFVIVTIVLIGFLVSCDMINELILSRTRPLTLIQTFNSNLEPTRRLVPNDTLFVQAQGLEPGELYQVQCLDPDGNVITELITIADENGVIGTSPLWYNIGFVVNDFGRLQLPDTGDEIFLRAFNIQIKSLDVEHTNFKLPFFFITDDDAARSRPILMSGKKIDDEFYLSNAYYSEFAEFGPSYQYIITYYNDNPEDPLTDEVIIKADRLEALEDDSLGARLWVLPYQNVNYEDGDYIVEHAYFYNQFDTGSDELKALLDGNMVTLVWPAAIDTIIEEDPDDRNAAGFNPQNKIPEWAEGKAFSLFLDMRANGVDESGVYHVKFDTSYFVDAIDGNGAPAFVVREKVAEPELKDLIHMNLASSGYFQYNYTTWTYDYGYNDTFKVDGSDTLYSSYYQVARGVKVIWNPYIAYPGWGPTSGPSVFWGQSVDVYIVESADLTLMDDLTPAPGTVKRRVPVQYSCGNGLSQQTIWPAPMVTGNYLVIVDMDLDGKLSDGDLVDNLQKNGNPWTIDGKDLGFRVLP